jgi:hypothetical protein
MTGTLAPVLHHTVVVQVTAGLDGVLRVAAMLRGRRYPVRDLTVDVHEGATASELRATVLLSGPDTDLLLERLRRMPAVLAARRV